jgi:hypothetical protein
VHLRHGWMPARSLTKWSRVGPYGRMGCGLAAAAGSTRSGHAPRDSAGESPRVVSRPGSGRQPPKRTSGFPRVRGAIWAKGRRRPGLRPRPQTAECVAFRRVESVSSQGGQPESGKRPWLFGLCGLDVVSRLRHQDLA